MEHLKPGWFQIYLDFCRQYKSCTLRSWVHPILLLFKNFSRQLKDNDTCQCCSDCFPHWPHISGCVQNCRTTFQCIVVLQWQGEVPEKAHNYGTELGNFFRTFSPCLENNDTLKCSSDMWSMWKTVRSQDLRVQQKWIYIFTWIKTF